MLYGLLSFVLNNIFLKPSSFSLSCSIFRPETWQTTQQIANSMNWICFVAAKKLNILIQRFSQAKSRNLKRQNKQLKALRLMKTREGPLNQLQFWRKHILSFSYNFQLTV